MPNPNLPVRSALHLALIITFGFTATLSQAQIPTQIIEPTYVSIADGVVSPTVYDVLQDSYGLIWIGTANGLQKYDGYRFETFKNISGKSNSLQSNTVWALFEDNHDIWVSSNKGVSRYIRSKNEFKNYSFAQTFGFTTDSDVPGYKFFKDSQNRLWVNTLNIQLAWYDVDNDTWKKAVYEVPDVPEPDHIGRSYGLAEDSKGNLWLASWNYGLMRKAKDEGAFRPVAITKPRFDFTTDFNKITGLYMDSTNTLWITTRIGVYKYDTEKEELRIIKEYTDDSENGWTQMNAIERDSEGNIWIANNLRGPLKFEGITDRYTEIQLAGKMKLRGFGWTFTLTQFMQDRSGIFWFGTAETGMMKYDPVNKPFQSIVHDPNNPNTLSKGGAFGILASKVKPGVVYVGTRGGGVNVYDPKKTTIDKVSFKVVDDMFGGSARAIGEDTDGSLWLGTWGDGVVKLDKNFKEVTRYKYDSTNNNSLSHNQVRVVKPDKNGRVWLGTNYGLNFLDTKTNVIHRVTNKHGRPYPDLLVKEVEKLMATEQKIGIIEKVIDNQNLSQPVEIKEDGTYWVMAVAEMDPSQLVDLGWIENAAKDTVWKMSQYDQTMYAGGAYKNRIEIGNLNLEAGSYTLHYRTDDSHAYGKWNEAAPTYTSLYGIALLKAPTGDKLPAIRTDIVPEKEELYTSGSNINDIEVTDKYVWVSGEGGGVDRIDPATNQVKSYSHNPDDPNSLSHNNVKEILADSKGMLWFATNDGLTRLDPVTEIFTRYSEADGLPTNLTEGIVEGDNGEIWIATQNGLSQMVINERLGKATFINYNSTDGLTGDAFLSLTNTRATDGRFYFGSERGLTTFSSITANNLPPAIIISNFFISNKSVLEMQEDSPLTESLFETKSVSLPFNQNSLSFEFAALHYANPKKNQYAHMLEGYDQDWIYDNRNFAAYTNLDPGTYKFKVRAANAYGIWNEDGLTLEITILPPWWRTWWAYASYIVVFAGFAFTADRTVRRSIKLRERERSRERELKQAKEIERAYTELKATQSQLIQSEKMASLGELTAGIAHEIQNPLNFVNNFAEINKELIDELKQEIESGNLNEAKTIADTLAQNESKVMFHGKRADGIVKGMLQHSRASSGQKEPTDINELCDEYLRLSYHGLRAKDKSFNATFKTDFDPTIGKVNVVPQDIGRVVLNLLTNAFYAVNEKKKKVSNPYEPTVTVTTKLVSGKVVIQVQDNGNGIPESITQKIFQPFFTTKPAGQGTGLGLSLSYDIVTKGHSGNLTVESKEGEGSTFILVLPN